MSLERIEDLFEWSRDYPGTKNWLKLSRLDGLRSHRKLTEGELQELEFRKYMSRRYQRARTGIEFEAAMKEEKEWEKKHVQAAR